MLGNKIRFTGPVENVHEYLRASDIFLLNSKREGTPNALLEAMACGIPPVMKSLDGIDQYITYKNKNAIILDDLYELIKIFPALTVEQELSRIGSEAFETIKNGMTFDHVMNLLLEQNII